MIKLLVMCGTGVATSTIASEKVKTWLKEHNYDEKVNVTQGKISDEITKLEEYDIILSTTAVPERVEDKVIMASSLITGINVDQTYQHVQSRLDQILAEN